jgi:5-methyltetrahydropteroyltriglutamate--homocysteine methyltransferase
MANDFKYHIDHHASLIPHADLVAARLAHASGDVDDAALRAAEDSAVDAALSRERRAGLSAVSDGQFRRRNAVSVVFDALNDAAERLDSTGPIGELVGPAFAPERRALQSEPSAERRIAKQETDYLLSATRLPVMVALPSPGYLHELSDGDGSAWAGVLRAEIAALAADGVAYVQVHNPIYAFLLTAEGRANAATLGLDADATVQRMLEIDNAVLDGIETPADFRIGLDLTTGSIAPTRSGYDIDAVARFLNGQRYDRLCVEYPVATTARFPLEPVPGGCIVALGVVDVSDTTLEPVDSLVSRMDEAAALYDVDDLAVATNGGFALSPPDMTEPGQWAKLQQIEMVARYIWGNEL